MFRLRFIALLPVLLGSCCATAVPPAEVSISNGTATLAIDPLTGSYRIHDHRAQVVWESNPYARRFGTAVLSLQGKERSVELSNCSAVRQQEDLELTFWPNPGLPSAWIKVRIVPLRDPDGFEFRYQTTSNIEIRKIRLLESSLPVGANERAFVVVPVREGLLIPAGNGVAFKSTFDTYAYEGCHMQMLGLVKSGGAMLVTWADPYVLPEIESRLPGGDSAPHRQTVTTSLELRKSAHSVRIYPLGPGGYVEACQAYRRIAARRGWVVPWARKLAGHPERSGLFGAINFKLWSTLSRTMNDASTQEESASVQWTFDEAAQVASHLYDDLHLRKVLFLMGGWIHRGYDNQHPDILPSAPECGGDVEFARCCEKIRALGYLLGLHDNYQDMYRDAPSWDEDYLMRLPDGGLAKGGQWAGGRAFLTCSQKAVQLAARSQNLPGVRKLTGANAYFIDTTYAAGLMECFDSEHPLSRWDDLYWKQVISDVARSEFGIFGSECGREWAIPHSDFFEGLTGVSGDAYHDSGLLKRLGAVSVPLFELVYRDCIAMYGKYGYEESKAADYVLRHLVLGRTLHYHSVPAHLYWKQPLEESNLEVQPGIAEFQSEGSREFRLTYSWEIKKTPSGQLTPFIHFTDKLGTILFQDDYRPERPVNEWLPGQIQHRSRVLRFPAGFDGSIGIRAGLFDAETGRRAQLRGPVDGQQRIQLGTLRRQGDRVVFERMAESTESSLPSADLFTRAEGGWAEGLHPADRFLKNTYEVLSPLNEFTSLSRMTGHRFLSDDYSVQESLFGQGRDEVRVVVNGSATSHTFLSRTGGKVVLPPRGFLVEGRKLVAFHALSWGGVQYETPPLFVLRSEDGLPLARSRKLRVYHGFGDPRLHLGNARLTVQKEDLIDMRSRCN
jgi:hypothetical protein